MTQTLDGVFPDRVERPVTADEAATLAGEVNERGDWMLPFGGATALSGANPVDAIPIALDMTGVAGIVEYEPTDLTVSVRAGTRWSDLQAALGREGQVIPVDVPLPDRATVGGVVATGYAGPRRLRDGSLKDLILGASYVRGDGLAAKAGGMVVKNVSGFEIPRLLHGSWGSLAVLTSVNLKVIPAHEFELTIQGAELDTVDAAGRVLALTRSQTAIAAAVLDGTLETASTAVRLTGREGPTRALSSDVERSADIPWSGAIDDPIASSAWWQVREDRHASDEERVSIEIGVEPSRLVDTLETLRRALPGPRAFEVRCSPGIGAIDIAFAPSAVSLAAWIRIWQEHGLANTARFVVAAAPRNWRAGQDVWFIAPGPRRIMQSLKYAFDPNDTLNRGRLWIATAASLT